MTLKFSKSIVKAVLEKSGGRCWYCGIELTPESRDRLTPQTYCIDHLFPISKGGVSEIDNLVPSCWKCNGSKGTHTVEEFRVVMTRRDHKMPAFAPEQIEFLKANGIKLPEFPPHVFYFEKAGL